MIPFWKRINISTRIGLWATVFSLVFGFGACKKSDNDLGLNLRPDGGIIDGIIKNDFNIITRTVSEDSLQTDSLSRNLLGAIYDPIFGISTAAVYFDLALPEINIDFGANPKLDSVVLSIVLDTKDLSYGNTTTKQHIVVKELDELLEAKKQYYHPYTPATKGILADGNYSFGLKDTIEWLEENKKLTAVGMVRIPLSNTLGNALLNADPSSYGSNQAFRDFLKGLYVSALSDNLSPGEGALHPVNLINANSKVTLFYNDSLKRDFLVNSTSQRVGEYSNQTESQISNQFDKYGMHFNETYVRGMGGAKTKINIEGLYDLVADGQPILINEAKLTLSVKSGSTSSDYPAPPRLLLLQPSLSDSTANTFILDLIDEIAPPSGSWLGFTNYGGILDEDKQEYVFHINRHLQDLIQHYLATGEKKDRGFYVIVPSDNPITPSRLVLDNDQSGSDPKIELKVTYIKL
jgi:hypothetical protein